MLGAIFRCILDALVGSTSSKGQHQQPAHFQPAKQTPSPAARPWEEGRSGKTRTFNDYLGHARNPHYVALREKADRVGSRTGELSRQSREAYEAGDGAEAKRLSDEAKALRAEKNRLNREAADWIFKQNNWERGPGEIDLHGLRAEEAVERTEARIVEAGRNGLPELRIIVGKGLHSRNHESVLKPRIEELMHKHDLVVEVDPQNGGVLIVHFDKRTGGGEIVGSDEIDKRCIVM